MGTAPIKTKFERYEIKFWIPEETTQDVLRWSAPYAKPDPHNIPGEGQFNTSVYLDTSDLLFARLHASGSPDRSKLRVRRYGNPPSGPGYFEVKRKVKNVIFKRRAVVPWEYAEDLVEGTYTSLPRLGNDYDQRSLEAFLYLMTVHGARPKIIIRSKREAFAAIDPDEDVRFTFDREVLYQPATNWRDAPCPRSWVPIDCVTQTGEHGRRVLVELKFRGAAPLWMAEMVDRLGMWRVAYSKYMSAILRELRDFGGTPGWPAGRS